MGFLDAEVGELTCLTQDLDLGNFRELSRRLIFEVNPITWNYYLWAVIVPPTILPHILTYMTRYRNVVKKPHHADSYIV